MSEEKIKIPTIKAESETQTSGQFVKLTSAETKPQEMESGPQSQNMSIRKRRNLSKNRAQAARQREKTPEPGRTSVPHEDTTTDDEDTRPFRTSREIEADNTYEEMKRLVSEKANVKDPVYDINTEEVLVARVVAASERRRRSISPFALPEKEDFCNLERKGSFIDPSNKLLSTNYALSPKDEDLNRRSSLTIDPLLSQKKGSVSSSAPTTASPKDKEFPYPLPSTPKKLEKMVYPDEFSDSADTKAEAKITPKRLHELNFEEKQEKRKTAVGSPKIPETPTTPGELVTKVIQVERTPSKKLSPENKPNVEIRERIVRTPSKKIISEAKPGVVKQQPNKITKEEPPSKVPPVKPVRSKSASRFGGKTSESEMSEDQSKQHNMTAVGSRRKVVPTPRRFIKNKSPRANRSLSVNRAEDLKDAGDKQISGMSQTSREIMELMQKARARSLSIPKDDPRLLSEYINKNLATPNKTPSNLRSTRGISCPKTIQIISDKEILLGLTTDKSVNLDSEKNSKHSSGYVDASQSEYTSSCYSSSPSENEFEFDLSERKAELTRKLNILSKEVTNRDSVNNNIIMKSDDIIDENLIVEQSVLRKRSIGDRKSSLKKTDIAQNKEDSTNKITETKKTKIIVRSRWKLFANWQQFKHERYKEYETIKLLRNRCICDLFVLIIMCGLGGMMFKTLEGSFENAYKCGSRNVKRDFIESLWRGSHYLREEDWKSMARKKLYEFENQLHTAHEAGVSSYSGQRSWNFMNSFVYCLTLVTTIGYGHIAPKTTYGRVATIIYAVIGIPLFLIVLADFGKLFTRIIKFFWSFIRRFYYTRSCRSVRRTVHVQEVMKGLNIVYDVVRRPSQIFSEEDMEIGNGGDQPPPVQRRPSDDLPPPLPPKPGTIREVENETEPDTPAPSVFEIDDEFNLPISVAITILVIYIIIGAVGFNLWESWNFFESFYFVFISMSTIGLGDFVPDHPIFMMASILYLVFGLALTSMCINVVQVKLSDTFRQASAKLGATIGLKVAEEDGSLVPITPPPTEIVPVHKSKVETEESNNVIETENDTKNR